MSENGMQEASAQYLNVVTMGGVAVLRRGESGFQVLMQASVENILSEMKLEGLLAWTVINQLRQISAELRQLNQRAEAATSGGLEDMTEQIRSIPGLSDLPGMDAVLAHFGKRS